MVEVKGERVQEIFDTISKDYDKMNNIISFKQHDIWRKKTMKKLGNLNGVDALDLCCGTGDWSFDLIEAGAKVTGIDFSEGMLEVAKKRDEKNQITFLQGDAMSLPFEDNSFDLVTIGYGLRNTPDYSQVLSEIYRVLKSNGRLVCIDTSHPTNVIYKPLFNFYFSVLMPLLGKVFSNSYEEYQWLQKSAKDFPDAKSLKELFEKAGFVEVIYNLHSGGAAASHFGTKK